MGEIRRRWPELTIVGEEDEYVSHCVDDECLQLVKHHQFSSLVGELTNLFPDNLLEVPLEVCSLKNFCSLPEH